MAVSVHSSEQFSTAMINGWDEVLCHKFPGTIFAQGIYLKLITNVYKKIKKKRRLVRISTDLGDLDYVVLFPNDVEMKDILPLSGYLLRGGLSLDSSISGFFATVSGHVRIKLR